MDINIDQALEQVIIALDEKETEITRLNGIIEEYENKQEEISARINQALINANILEEVDTTDKSQVQWEEQVAESVEGTEEIQA